MERPKTKAFNVVSLRGPTGRAQQFIVPTTLVKKAVLRRQSSEGQENKFLLPEALYLLPFLWSKPAWGDFPDVGRKPAAKRFSYST